MIEVAANLPERMTVAEFLEWNDGSDTRYELVDGRVVAMAPPAPVHSLIAANIARVLGNRLKPPCRAVVEYGVHLPHDDHSWFQADVAVVCGGIPQRGPGPEPVVVVEVVSRSSFDHDRGRKTHDYKQLSACRCILIVESERRHVERWTRHGEEWIVRDHIGERGQVPVDGVDVVIDLAEIYDGVGFD